MFDDIDKIIPKLDENDKEKIYRNISKKKVEKKAFNKKLILAFASVILLALIVIPISIAVGINNKPANTINTPPLPIETQTTHEVQFDENNVVGMAAYSEFKNNTTNVKKRFNKSSEGSIPEDSNVETMNTGEGGNNNTTSTESNKIYDKISYPYDYVKIKTAYKFTIEVERIEDELANQIIESNCGLGKLEVVVAEFETFVDENGNLVSSVGDTMISLRGYNGYYTILLNHASYEYQGDARSKSTSKFSSHKKLNSDGVEKDFTPPILTIVLVEENDTKSLYFEANMSKKNVEFNKELAFNNIDEVVRVSRDTLYSAMELSKVKTVEVAARVVEIDLEKKVIIVESDVNLKYVYILSFTEGLNIEDIKIDDLIIVEHDKIFDEYNPVGVNANKISLNTTNENKVEDKQE